MIIAGAEMASIVDRMPHSGQVHRMFMISDAEAKLVREAYVAGGEQAASDALRGVFRGLADNDETRASAVAIAGWAPMPAWGTLSRAVRPVRPR